MADQKFQTIDPISPEEAEGYIRNWVEKMNLNADPSVITEMKRSFLVSHEDINAIYEGHHGFRIYLGKNNIAEDSDMRLILVPVDESYKDVFNTSVYDFSTPCPHTCQDTTSRYYVRIKQTDDSL